MPAVKKAAIPIGGLGTRLYPFTVDASKPMVRFLNRFIIDFILNELALQGIDEVFLGVSGFYNYRDLYDHLGERFSVRVENNRKETLKLRYQPNIPSVGNAHSVAILADYYDINEPLLIVQSDTIVSLDLADLIKQHEKSEASMTIALSEVSDKEYLRQLGVAKLRPDMSIEYFVEKPSDPEKAPSNLANTGVYLLSDDVVKFLRSDEFRNMVSVGKADFGRDVIPYLINKGFKVSGYVLKGYWFDIGSIDAYYKAAFYLLKTLPPQQLGATTVYHDTIYMQGASARSRKDHVELIERAAKGLVTLEGHVLLGRHSSISDNVEISDSIVDNYTVIGRETRISRSIIMDRTIVGSKSAIERSIVGRHVKIGDGVSIRDSYIGNDVMIGDDAVLENAIVWPHRSIESGTRISGRYGVT